MIFYNKNSNIVNSFTEDILLNSLIHKDTNSFSVHFKSSKYHNLFRYTAPEKHFIEAWRRGYVCNFCTNEEEFQQYFSHKVPHTLWDVFGKNVHRFLESEEKLNTLMFDKLFQNVFQNSCFVVSREDFEKLQLQNVICNAQFFENIKNDTGIEPIYVSHTVNVPNDNSSEMRYIYVCLCYMGDKKEEHQINKYFMQFLYQSAA